MYMDILNKAFGKKGQLQIQETILAVFIFVVLIMFGLIFFYRVQSASIVDSFNEFQLEKLSVDFITLGDLPEFSCSRAGVKESCIDTVKLNSFIGLYKTRPYDEYYEQRFGFKNITIYQVYPSCTGNECAKWNVYLNKPEDVESKIVRDTPVSLYFPCTGNDCENDEYRIGVMIVEAYNV